MIFIILTILLKVLASSLDVKAIIPSSELIALNDIYVSTKGYNWYWKEDTESTTWDFNATVVNPCVWQGITCSCLINQTNQQENPNFYYFDDDNTNNTKYCSVVKLNLINYNLRGYLPNSIGNLLNLTKLHLDQNGLYNQIPTSIWNLEALEILSLSYNKLTGTIPLNIQNLYQLKNFVLSNNEFYGTIPGKIGYLTSLQIFLIDDNHFTGSIPTYIGNLVSLTHFHAHRNYLNGYFPYNFGYCLDLKELEVYGNSISGTMPSQLGFLSNLQILSLNDNNMHGPLPDSIGKMVSLTTLYLYNNKFTGTLPTSIGLLSNLQILTINNNFFRGTLPTSIGLLTSLTHLTIKSNIFQNSIPSSIASLINLENIELSYNFFSGTIPSSICTFKNLSYLAISFNNLSGTIPATCTHLEKLTTFMMNHNRLEGNFPEMKIMPQLAVISVFQNSLSGPIPSSLCSITSLEQVLFNENRLTGPIPSCIDALTKLNYISVHDNSLTSTIPSQIGKLSLLETIQFFNNKLSGNIPSSMSNLNLSVLDLHGNKLTGTVPSFSNQQFLKQFFVFDNLLSGSISDIFSANNINLLNVDISNNRFSGSLPSSVFDTKSLLTFAAVSNCFEVYIPENSCTLSDLQVLALDGMHANKFCQSLILKGTKDTAYMLEEIKSVMIPSCLFDMNSLTTLHLSGNGFKGSLDSIEVKQNLVDLSLSHNRLVGLIPSSIQNKKNWINLDLSYNQLTGVLLTNFTMESDSSLSLEVNRLSGNIPKTFSSLDTISILDGNMFDCVDSTSLPVSDPKALTYSCGSSQLYFSLFVWVSLLVVSILPLIVVFYLVSRYVKRLESYSWLSRAKQVTNALKSWMKIFVKEHGSDITNYGIMGDLMYRIRKIAFVITSIILIILLPCFIAMSKSLPSKYTFSYVWIVSPAYLSGATAAYMVFVILSIALSLVTFLFHIIISKKYTQQISSDEDKGLKVRQYLALILVAVLNTIIVFTSNALFVAGVMKYSSFIVSILSIVMSIFKLLWGSVVIPSMFSYFSKFYLPKNAEYSGKIQLWQLRNIFFQVSISIFNNIVVPCLATAAVNPNCFFNTLIAAPTVEASYMYKTCMKFSNHRCSEYASETYVTSYSPPFIYNYLCSATLVNNYATVYIYMFTTVAFVTPIKSLLLKLSHGYLKQYNRINAIMHNLLDPKLLPISNGTEITLLMATNDDNDTNQPLLGLESDTNQPLLETVVQNETTLLFSKTDFTVAILSYFAILLTFGIVFAPLSIIICIAIFSETYYNQLLIGRLKHNLSIKDTSPKTVIKLKVLDEQIEGIEYYFIHSLKLICPFSFIFLSLFLFDLYGNNSDSSSFVWMPLTFCTIPLIISCLIWFITQINASYINDSSGIKVGSKFNSVTLQEGIMS